MPPPLAAIFASVGKYPYHYQTDAESPATVDAIDTSRYWQLFHLAVFVATQTDLHQQDCHQPCLAMTESMFILPATDIYRWTQ